MSRGVCLPICTLILYRCMCKGGYSRQLHAITGGRCREVCCHRRAEALQEPHQWLARVLVNAAPHEGADRIAHGDADRIVHGNA